MKVLRRISSSNTTNCGALLPTGDLTKQALFASTFHLRPSQNIINKNEAEKNLASIHLIFGIFTSSTTLKVMLEALKVMIVYIQLNDGVITTRQQSRRMKIVLQLNSIDFSDDAFILIYGQQC